MKTLKLIAIGITLFVSNLTQAQVSVNINAGTAPAWGPAVSPGVRYYYLPDVETYYDVQSAQFISYNGSNWTRSKYLPRKHRGYNLHNGYKVVLNDYHGATPYANFSNHKAKYFKGHKNGIKPNNGVLKNHKNGKGKKH